MAARSATGTTHRQRSTDPRQVDAAGAIQQFRAVDNNDYQTRTSPVRPTEAYDDLIYEGLELPSECAIEMITSTH